MRPTLAFALAAFSAGVCATSVSARDREALNACFAPDVLKAVSGENVAMRGNRRYDGPVKFDGYAPSAEVPESLRGSIRRVDLPAGEKYVALTFDLCEQRGEVAGYDGRIIDYLRTENIKATLFLGGKWMASHAARTEQLLLDPLFEIGNHTETHRNLRLVQPDALRDEIISPQKIYERARARVVANQCAAPWKASLSEIPAQPRLLRFPYGACNEASMKAVNDAGMLAIQWDLATGDPNPHQSAAAIAAAVVRRSKPGSIVVAHANGRGWHTAEALPIAIPLLKAKGYKFVTVSELLALGKPLVSATCYDNKPGDTDRYDFLSALQHRLDGKRQQTAGNDPMSTFSTYVTPSQTSARQKHRSDADPGQLATPHLEP